MWPVLTQMVMQKSSGLSLCVCVFWNSSSLLILQKKQSNWQDWDDMWDNTHKPGHTLSQPNSSHPLTTPTPADFAPSPVQTQHF